MSIPPFKFGVKRIILAPVMTSQKTPLITLTTEAIEGGLIFLSLQFLFLPDETEGTSFNLAVELIGMMNEIIKDNPEKFTFINDPSDIKVLEENKNLVGIAWNENGAPIEGKLENIKYFADLGVNYITLAHAKSNHISDSSYDENKRWKDGLSPGSKW